MGLARLSRVIGLALLAPASGCFLLDSFATNDFSGDEFPILVDTTSGAVIVGMRQSGADDRTAVLDILSPLSVVDPGPTVSSSVSIADVTILGLGAGGELDLPRARLDNAQLVSDHPCGQDESSNDVSPCTVGSSAAPRPYSAIIGADVLAGDAVRMRLGEDTMFILPDIGGEGDDRTKACDAVFPTPYRGGGTLILDAGEVTFTGRRIKLDICLGADARPDTPQSYRGANVMFVASTSIGPSIIGEVAYDRYVAAIAGRCQDGSEPCALPRDQLPEEIIYLPSGPVVGRLAVIPSLALTAQNSNPSRAACRHVYANHFLTQRSCVEADQDCPCDTDPEFCSVPAVVELAPATGLPIVVISDADRTLQALRTELRPGDAEVDGILGTSALRNVELDVDYPHNRVLARCTGDGCIARPALADVNERDQNKACLRDTPPGPDFPLQ